MLKPDKHVYLKRGDLVAMRAVVLTAIAERESAAQWQREPKVDPH